MQSIVVIVQALMGSMVHVEGVELFHMGQQQVLGQWFEHCTAFGSRKQSLSVSADQCWIVRLSG